MGATCVMGRFGFEGGVGSGALQTGLCNADGFRSRPMSRFKTLYRLPFESRARPVVRMLPWAPRSRCTDASMQAE